MNVLNDLFQKIVITIASVFTVISGAFTGQGTVNESLASPLPSIQASPNIDASPSAEIISLKQKTTRSTPIPTPNYDGTRTGPIIEYNELCTGKKISIQVNEQIRYTDRSGKERLLTAGDIHCLVLNDCISVINNIPKSSGSGEDQIERLQRERDIQRKASDGVVNQYYEWKYKWCNSKQSDLASCQKSASDEKNQLLDQCRKAVQN